MRQLRHLRKPMPTCEARHLWKLREGLREGTGFNQASPVWQRCQDPYYDVKRWHVVGSLIRASSSIEESMCAQFRRKGGRAATRRTSKVAPQSSTMAVLYLDWRRRPHLQTLPRKRGMFWEISYEDMPSLTLNHPLVLSICSDRCRNDFWILIDEKTTAVPTENVVIVGESD